MDCLKHTPCHDLLLCNCPLNLLESRNVYILYGYSISSEETSLTASSILQQWVNTVLDISMVDLLGRSGVENELLYKQIQPGTDRILF